MTLRISALLLLPALVIGPALRAQPVFHEFPQSDLRQDDIYEHESRDAIF